MRSAEGELLRECLRAEPRTATMRQTLPECRPGRVVAALTAHRVTCTVAPVLLDEAKRRRGSVPPEVIEHLMARRMQMAAHWLRMQADLGELGGNLDAAGVGWLVVKGPVVAQSLYGSVGAREWSDLDLLVDRRAFGAVVDRAQESGARLVDQNWSMIRARLQGELSLELGKGTPLDLHWHLINGRSKRQSFSVDVDAVLSRSSRLEIGRLLVPSPDPVDQFLHLCLHACLSGGHRLQWIKDVERACHAVTDWADVVGRARAWRTELPTALILDRARTTLGAAVPRAVLTDLAPRSAYVKAARLLAALRAPQRSHESAHSGGLLLLRARTSGATSLVAMREARLGQRQSQSPGDDVDAGNPLHAPGGTSEDRAAYFAAVSGPRSP